MTLTIFKRMTGAAVLVAAALPAQAASYHYSLAPGSLLLGSALAGSFSGSDANGDGLIALSELASFDVSYTGPTSSFTIVGTPLAFDFDTTTDQLTFAIADVSFDSVSADTYDGGSYAVLSADGPDAGSGAMTITAVPEPSTVALLAGGLGLLATARLRRRSGASRR